jgi:hypothetical protein
MDALVAQGKAERLGRLRGVEQDRVGNVAAHAGSSSLG